MLALQSLTQQNLRYIFDVQDPAATMQDITKDRSIRPATIDFVLELASDQPPIRPEDHNALNAIIGDCSCAWLREAYQDSYGALIQSLSQMEVQGNTIRVFTVTKEG